MRRVAEERRRSRERWRRTDGGVGTGIRDARPTASTGDRRSTVTARTRLHRDRPPPGISSALHRGRVRTRPRRGSRLPPRAAQRAAAHAWERRRRRRRPGGSLRQRATQPTATPTSAAARPSARGRGGRQAPPERERSPVRACARPPQRQSARMMPRRPGAPAGGPGGQAVESRLARRSAKSRS